jgi:hypothetical protein
MNQKTWHGAQVKELGAREQNPGGQASLPVKE